MLTVAKITAQSAGAYTQYLESPTASSERGDYYLKDGRQRRRRGRALRARAARRRRARPRALDAALTSEAFSAVMNGHHPVRGQPLRRAGADTTRVVALDLTYSVPKSVSVVWAFADADLRARLEAAGDPPSELWPEGNDPTARLVPRACRSPTMNARRRMDAELDAVIDEITVDCHDEDEQLSAFENAFYDATFPCRGVVVGEEVDVVSVGIADGRRELVAACERRGRRYEVALLDRAIDADEDTARLLAA